MSLEEFKLDTCFGVTYISVGTCGVRPGLPAKTRRDKRDGLGRLGYEQVQMI